ncbi:MAG: MMPL family transporter, partial [Myxococcales bacterium]|nr:MMPL family transporter [Myxococcales bacterium]
ARPAQRFSRALALPLRHARAILVVTAILTAAALALLPRIRFDASPLRVRDPSTDSVQALNEMLADGDALPWNLNALASNLDEAAQLAARIEALPAVDLAVTLADFVPEQQDRKLALLADAAFILLPTLEASTARVQRDAAECIACIDRLARSLSMLDAPSSATGLRENALRLRRSLAALRERAATDPSASLDALESALIGSLPERLRLLRTSLQAGAVTISDLPEGLIERMVASDGRARIEIFPEEDLNDPQALEDYVASVQALAPRAFGEGLVILETGRVVVRALHQALLTAAVLIFVLLLSLWRSVVDAALVALPLGLATLFTAALSVPLGVSFNFANVIVIPLLLGMGVDTGIHLIHRRRSGDLPGGNVLRTSTAGAALLSSLTTMASFGTLGFSSHLGMASLGRLLTLGIAVILVCNLVVLPALAHVVRRAESQP